MFSFRCISFHVLRQHQPLFIYGPNKRWGKTLNEARTSRSLYFLPLSPYFCQYPHRLHLKPCFGVPSPWHSSLAHSPGPLVECCIVWGLWRKGILGHRESAHVCTHTRTTTRTHRQIQLLRAITTLWQTSKSKTSGVGRPPFRREREKKKEKSHIFHVCCVKVRW